MISYGMHLSASGAMTSLYRQDVITNNLANATTPAFKPDLALQVARDPARVEDGLFHLPSTGPFGDLLEGAELDPLLDPFDAMDMELIGPTGEATSQP